MARFLDVVMFSPQLSREPARREILKSLNPQHSLPQAPSPEIAANVCLVASFL